MPHEVDHSTGGRDGREEAVARDVSEANGDGFPPCWELIRATGPTSCLHPAWGPELSPRTPVSAGRIAAAL